MEQQHQVRVYQDGRICVPAPLLKMAWEETCGGKQELPPQVFIGPHRVNGIEKGYALRWTGNADDQAYSLSSRERVLFGNFPKGRRYDVEIEKSTGSLLIKIAPKKLRAAPKKKTPTPTTKKVVRRKRVPTLEERTRKPLRESNPKFEVLALRTLFPHMTLAEAASYCPNLTVGELVFL